ncbi:MAG TPA: DUF177 domain-containing protein [Candidatus Dorea gallistercoris]|uniref:DUF177 domain-containing protein n=1 Tax=Candidatus Dorea gallistercoris TaxID=2838542 RepID=A0A9D1UE01_9FIRM|nr:DUF177 domain-containing protein [Candidatus Dorea gallistercoris]
MLLDLSDVLSEQHTAIERDVPIEMEKFALSQGCFPILEKSPLSVMVEHVKERKLRITGKARLVFSTVCDRCLTPVETPMILDFAKTVDLDEPEGSQTEDFDEANYIDGYTLDVDQMIRNEILIRWPTKILCGEDCKGICSVCGQNLNEGTCDCEDTSLDPRMSVIRDMFKNFKEV